MLFQQPRVNLFDMVVKRFDKYLPALRVALILGNSDYRVVGKGVTIEQSVELLDGLGVKEVFLQGRGIVFFTRRRQRGH